MELEDLVLRHYRVERRGDDMVAIQDPNGNYKAESADKIERALTAKCSLCETDNIFVRTSGRGRANVWHPMIRK